MLDLAGGASTFWLAIVSIFHQKQTPHNRWDSNRKINPMPRLELRSRNTFDIGIRDGTDIPSRYRRDSHPKANTTEVRHRPKNKPDIEIGIGIRKHIRYRIWRRASTFWLAFVSIVYKKQTPQRWDSNRKHTRCRNRVCDMELGSISEFAMVPTFRLDIVAIVTQKQTLQRCDTDRKINPMSRLELRYHKHIRYRNSRWYRHSGSISSR
jgi:hypothetical protein